MGRSEEGGDRFGRFEGLFGALLCALGDASDTSGETDVSLSRSSLQPPTQQVRARGAPRGGRVAPAARVRAHSGSVEVHTSDVLILLYHHEESSTKV